VELVISGTLQAAVVCVSILMAHITFGSM